MMEKPILVGWAQPRIFTWGGEGGGGRGEGGGGGGEGVRGSKNVVMFLRNVDHQSPPGFTKTLT